MEEKKLTDEEIIKELINESNRGEWCELNFIDCVEVRVLKNAIDLIYRLQGEIEQLKSTKYRESWKAKFFKAQAEIERLKDENIEERDIHFKNLCGYKDEIARLQKQVDELKEERYYTEQDTAKEILDDLRNIFIEQSSYGCDTNQHIGYYDYEVKMGLVIEQIEEYAKEKYGIEYGVEVDE